MIKVGAHLKHIQMKKEQQLHVQEKEIKELFTQIKHRLDHLTNSMQFEDEFERKKLTKKYQDYLERRRAFSDANTLMNKYE